MNNNLKKHFLLFCFAAVSLSADCDDCAYEEEEAVAEEAPRYHLHFSSTDVDFYEKTPDTVYRDADWPSRIEEFSDYISH